MPRGCFRVLARRERQQCGDRCPAPWDIGVLAPRQRLLKLCTLHLGYVMTESDRVAAIELLIES